MATLRQRNKEIYWRWKSMKQRCSNPKCKAYKNYGYRGITVCKEWMTFEPFCDWCLKNGWAKGLDFDRIDNEKGYSPDNCRFIDRRSNINNRRRTVMIKVNDIEKPLTEWADIIGVDRALITYWIHTHNKEYAIKRIDEAQKIGYKPRDFSRNNRKRVIYIDEGIAFNSVKEAAEYIGLAPCTISNAIRQRGGKTAKGKFRWE